jgi:hypothetical protein
MHPGHLPFSFRMPSRMLPFKLIAGHLEKIS